MRPRLALHRVVAVALALSVLSARPAQAEIVERVVAVVNDEAVFLSELRRRAVPFLERALDAPTEEEGVARVEQLYGEILNQLIDELLIQQAAREMQVRVTREDVDRAIANVRRQNNLGEAEFWQAVRTQGYSESQYRGDVRAQLLRLKVLNQRARGRVNLTEEDVRRRYDQETRGATRRLRFRLSHVFFAVPSGSGATELAAVREIAASTRDQLTVETFDAAIQAHGGGDLGWLSEGDLPAALEQVVLTLEPGAISQVIRGPNGFHILYLRERERGAAGVPAFEERRDDLYRGMLEEAMARQQRLLLDELRRRAVVTRRL